MVLLFILSLFLSAPSPISHSFVCPIAENTHMSITQFGRGVKITSKQQIDIYSAHAGKVTLSKMKTAEGKYETIMMIRNKNTTVVYTNLINIRVKKNQMVESGATLGTNIGNGEKVYFEIWEKLDRIDPTKAIPCLQF